MKYRKKPVVIDAIQFTGDNHKEIINFGDDTFLQPFWSEKGLKETGRSDMFDNPLIVIRTLEGDMKVSENDFVIKGVQGEFYPCKPDIFHSTYDEVVEVVYNEGGKKTTQYIDAKIID